jgi:hypothetical protein
VGDDLIEQPLRDPHRLRIGEARQNLPLDQCVLFD